MVAEIPRLEVDPTVFEKKSARRRSVCLLVAAALIGGAGASGPVAAADPEVRRSLEALSHLDAMTAQVGYRIVTANAALCERQMPASGMLIHGIEQYGAEFRATAAEMFSLGAAPGVALVLGGSPAAKAGVQPGDALIAINGEAMPGAGAEGGKGAARGDFDRMAVVFDQVEAALKKGPVTLSLMRKGEPGEVRFSGAPACESRFQVLPDNALNAAADGRYVQISTAFIPYFKNEDEFAAILAHEVAHNILRHRDRLDEALQAARAQPVGAYDVLPVLFKRPLALHQTTFALGEAVAHLHRLWFGGQLRRTRDAEGIWRFAPA